MKDHITKIREIGQELRVAANPDRHGPHGAVADAKKRELRAVVAQAVDVAWQDADTEAVAGAAIEQIMGEARAAAAEAPPRHSEPSPVPKE